MAYKAEKAGVAAQSVVRCGLAGPSRQIRGTAGSPSLHLAPPVKASQPCKNSSLRLLRQSRERSPSQARRSPQTKRKPQTFTSRTLRRRSCGGPAIRPQPGQTVIAANHTRARKNTSPGHPGRSVPSVRGRSGFALGPHSLNSKQQNVSVDNFRSKRFAQNFRSKLSFTTLLGPKAYTVSISPKP